MSTVQHRLNPTSDTDTATVEVPVYDDGDGQELTDEHGVRAILALWAAQGGAERTFMRTVGRDFVYAASAGSGMLLDEWPESGDGTYCLDDAPVVRS